jgi:hypothetical protein
LGKRLLRSSIDKDEFKYSTPHRPGLRCGRSLASAGSASASNHRQHGRGKNQKDSDQGNSHEFLSSPPWTIAGN